jgi:hypothetical protein
LLFNEIEGGLNLKLSICAKFDSVLIINALANCYFPMQEMENSEYQLVKYSSNEYWAEKFCAIDRKWHNSLLHSILHFLSPFFSPKLIFFSFSLIFFAFCAFLTLIHSKYTVFQLKNSLLQKKKTDTDICHFSRFITDVCHSEVFWSPAKI